MTIKYIERRVAQATFIKPIEPEWGGIGKGRMETAKSGKLYPTETPHFNFRFTHGNEDLAPIVKEIYGDAPMSLDLMVLAVTTHTDPIERYMPNSMQLWAKSQYDDKRTLMLECDSETVTRAWNAGTKRHDYAPDMPCGFDSTTNKCSKGCKPTARLLVVLPALCQAVQAIGYFSLTIHGNDDIKDIISKFGRAGEHIPLITWRFNRVPKTASFPDEKDNGKMKERIHHPIQIEALNRYGGVNGLVNALVSGNQTTAPALPPVTMTQSGGYDDSVEYEEAPLYFDEELANTPAPTPKPTTQGNEQFSTKGLAMAIIRSLREHHRAHSEGVGITDILNTLGSNDLEDLGKAWERQFPTLTQDGFAKVIADEFVTKIK